MPLSTTNNTTSTKRWWMIVTGTVALLAVGGVATQFWKARPGSAATEEAPGSAKVTPQKKASSGTSPDRVYARVGKDVVTEDMLARECISRHGRDVLEDLINRLIIQQACEAQGKSVTQQEVEEEIATIARKFNLDPVEWQNMLRTERNISPEQYRMSVIWPMIALRKLAETDVVDKLTEADLQKEFERQYGPRAKCRMIMLDQLRRAQTVWKDCKEQPDEFDKLAQDHSVDPNSRSLGGVIPPIPRYSGNEAIEKVAFKLKVGEISGVVEIPTPAGTRYAILKGEGRTEPVVESLDEVRNQLVEELKERRMQESIARVFEKLKAETRVDNMLTKSVSHPETAPVNPAGKAPRATGIKQTSNEMPAAANRPKTAAGTAPVKK